MYMGDYFWLAMVLTPLVGAVVFALAYFTRPRWRVAQKRPRNF